MYTTLLKELHPWISRNERNINWDGPHPTLPALPKTLSIPPTEREHRALITPVILDCACNARQFSETSTTTVENIVVGITKNDMTNFASYPMTRFDLGITIEPKPRTQKTSTDIHFIILFLLLFPSVAFHTFPSQINKYITRLIPDIPFDVNQLSKSYVGNEITHRLKTDTKFYADTENAAIDMKLQYFHKEHIIHYVQNPPLAAGAIQNVQKLVWLLPLPPPITHSPYPPPSPITHHPSSIPPQPISHLPSPIPHPPSPIPCQSLKLMFFVDHLVDESPSFRHAIRYNRHAVCSKMCKQRTCSATWTFGASCS